jgi:hypothetical protein
MGFCGNEGGAIGNLPGRFEAGCIGKGPGLCAFTGELGVPGMAPGIGIAGSVEAGEAGPFPGMVGICGSWALRLPDPIASPNPAINALTRITHPQRPDQRLIGMYRPCG